MSLLPAAKVTVAKLVAPKNAFSLMVVTFAGMVIAERERARENAKFPITVSWLPAAKVAVVRLYV